MPISGRLSTTALQASIKATKMCLGATGDGMPGIVRAAQQCADAFDSIRRDDVDVLPPALYVAMRELARELRGAHTLFVHIAPSADAITTRDLASDIVEATRRFVAVYEDFESDLALTNYDRSMLTGMGIMARQRVLSE